LCVPRLPSIDEWLPEKHLVRFVVEVIDGLDLSGMTRRYWGSESASYHPALLLGCWCTAIRRGCFRAGSWNVRSMNSVAFRFITANGHPDDDTIATVGRRFLREIEGLTVRVLELAREMGLLKLGTAADQTRVGVPAGGADIRR